MIISFEITQKSSITMLSVNLWLTVTGSYVWEMRGPFIGQWRESGNEQRLVHREGWKVKMFYSRTILKYENLIADFTNWKSHISYKNPPLSFIKLFQNILQHCSPNQHVTAMVHNWYFNVMNYASSQLSQLCNENLLQPRLGLRCRH